MTTLEKSLIQDITRIHDSLELKREENYAYCKELLLYGLDGFIHTYLMQKASDMTSDKISDDSFIKKYSLIFDKTVGCFEFSTNKMKEEGIYIPDIPNYGKQFTAENRKVFLFNGDYRNIVGKESWRNKEYANKLMDRKWSNKDLSNELLIKNGLKFGKELLIYGIN